MSRIDEPFVEIFDGSFANFKDMRNMASNCQSLRESGENVKTKDFAAKPRLLRQSTSLFDAFLGKLLVWGSGDLPQFSSVLPRFFLGSPRFFLGSSSVLLGSPRFFCCSERGFCANFRRN